MQNYIKCEADLGCGALWTPAPALHNLLPGPGDIITLTLSRHCHHERLLDLRQRISSILCLCLSHFLNFLTHHHSPLTPLSEPGVAHAGYSVVEFALHDAPEVKMENDNNDDDDYHSAPEVIEAGEVSSLPGCAEDPEDVLRAVQVDQQAQAVVWLLSGNVRGHQIDQSCWSYLKHKQVKLTPDNVVPAPIVLIVLGVNQR